MIARTQRKLLLVAKSDYPPLAGNILLYRRDSGQLKDTKIGDVFEIAKKNNCVKRICAF